MQATETEVSILDRLEIIAQENIDKNTEEAKLTSASAKGKSMLTPIYQGKAIAWKELLTTIKSLRKT